MIFNRIKLYLFPHSFLLSLKVAKFEPLELQVIQSVWTVLSLE
jgi:hypothetical protein